MKKVGTKVTSEIHLAYELVLAVDDLLPMGQVGPVDEFLIDLRLQRITT